jgi:hypothetical protein
MAEAVNRTIDGNEYVIKPFMGMAGWRMQLRLSKMIGPALKEAIGALPKGKVADMLSSEIDPSALGGGVAALFEAIADQDPKGEFVAELLSHTTRNGALLTPSVINDVFAANYLEMMKAVFAVVSANGFFGLSGIGLDGLTGLIAQPSPARSTKA